MRCRLSDLCNKEVIHIETGVRIGYVDDIEVEIETCRLTSIVVYGKAKFWGFFGRGEDIIIKWSQIEVVGDDTILVKFNYCPKPKSSKWKIIREIFK